MKQDNIINWKKQGKIQFKQFKTNRNLNYWREKDRGNVKHKNTDTDLNSAQEYSNKTQDQNCEQEEHNKKQ